MMIIVHQMPKSNQVTLEIYQSWLEAADPEECLRPEIGVFIYGEIGDSVIHMD